ncbi:RNA polymerase sigma factor [Rhodococcus sp. RD6.2]|jgi:RNA polymerase sigma factor (sigma-70 family)|uniref:RNA polymerase sigma factor n=1 Tax=Rhodococcus sp. RD6.2 TaxID=260936 RepID=UPI00063B97D5|nr:RNA polymerase sigma factor [Rhodococcus sp. RD6.2]CRK49668.1 RNA polymerase sigma factor [Rhodococcus sp. RD6.2]
MTEAELLDLCRQGDARAFAQLVEPHRLKVWAVCSRITRNQQDAEDAFQDTLVAAWQNLHKFRGDSQLGTWLHRVAANASLAVIRRRKDVLSAQDDFLDVVDPAPSVADRVTTVAAVRAAIDTLPDDFREAIVLREVAGMTYQEIADHQRIPVQTVRSRISRARARLVAELTPSIS